MTTLGDDQFAAKPKDLALGMDESGREARERRMRFGDFAEIIENVSKWLEHIAKRLFQAS